MKPLLSLSLMLFLCASTAGCRHYSRSRIVSVWGDWNSYEQPAFVVDDKNHLPYRGPEVAYHNWMYGRRNYKPLPKKKRQRDADRWIAWGALPSYFTLPKFWGGNENAEDEPALQPTPEPVPESKIDTTQEISQPERVRRFYLPVRHDAPESPSNESTVGEDEFTFDFYPPGDLQAVPRSGPNSPGAK